MKKQVWEPLSQGGFSGFGGFLLGFESKNRGERESKMKRTDARKAVFKLLTCHEGLPREHLEF